MSQTYRATCELVSSKRGVHLNHERKSLEILQVGGHVSHG